MAPAAKPKPGAEAVEKKTLPGQREQRPEAVEDWRGLSSRCSAHPTHLGPTRDSTTLETPSRLMQRPRYPLPLLHVSCRAEGEPLEESSRYSYSKNHSIEGLDCVKCRSGAYTPRDVCPCVSPAIYYWQLMVLRGKSMRNSDGSAHDWHQ